MSTLRSSSRTSPPPKKTSQVVQTRFTPCMSKSATTASLRPASTSSWGASPSAKCASTNGRSTWSASGAPHTQPPGSCLLLVGTADPLLLRLIFIPSLDTGALLWGSSAVALHTMGRPKSRVWRLGKGAGGWGERGEDFLLNHIYISVCVCVGKGQFPNLVWST